MFSRQLTSSVFYHRTFIALFHRAASLLRSAVLCSVLRKLCAWAEIEGETWENAHEEEKVCVGMCIDGISHSNVCPGFDRVWAGCKMRATKDGWCLNLELCWAPPSACFGRGSCLKGRLDYFLHPECFIDTSRGIFSLCFCVLGASGTPDALQMSGSLIISPAFHTYVNFIVTDTRICSACTRVQINRLHRPSV